MDMILLVIDYTEKTIEQRCKWLELFEYNKEIEKKFQSCLIRKFPEDLNFTKEKEILLKSYFDCEEPNRQSFIYQKGSKFNYHLYSYCYSSKILNCPPYYSTYFKPDRYSGVFSHPFATNGVFQELDDYFKKKNKDTRIGFIDEFNWWIACIYIESL